MARSSGPGSPTVTDGGGPAPALAASLRPWSGRLRVPEGVGRVVVGCSGGADSSAALALTWAAGLEVTAVHVDHGLREASAGDFAVVSALASRLGVDAVSVNVAVSRGTGLEARARDARLETLARERDARDCDAVVLGHTRDDQAETVLLHLLRGSAGAGLAGIPEARPGIVHPILSLSRSDTVEICARIGVTPVHDPMNDDVAFRRVWLRREVIPLLEATGDRDLREVLARQAAVFRGESDFLDGLATEALAAAGVAPGDASTPVAALVTPDAAIARRMVRVWLGLPPPSLAEVEAVLAVARGERAAVELGDRGRVERSKGRLHRIGTRPAGRSFAPFVVPVPGGASGDGWDVETWIERAAPERWPDGRYVCVVDADVVGDGVVARPPNPGERFVPLGLSGTKSVASALAEAGIPRGERSHHPVVTTGAGTAVWVVGYRVDAHARVTASTRRYLWMRFDRPARSR